MSNAGLEDAIATIRASLERSEGPGGGLLSDMLAHHLGWFEHGVEAGALLDSGVMGKLVRPRLCLLSCRAIGGDEQAAVPAAAAVEMIHNYTLIHDDIEDRDEVRRGRPTLWKVYGEAQAINAGDYLHSLAYVTLITNLAGAKVDPERSLKALWALSIAGERLCAGQAHDLALQSREGVPEDEYLEMVTNKTGALMSAAASMGALLGGASNERAGAFGRFGEQLGVAFQIRDDILGIWGDPEKTGKPVGADLARKRCSYPVIWALARPEGADRGAILAAPRDSSPTALADAVAALERVGARERAEVVVAEMHRQAWGALEGLELEPRAAEELRGLTEFLTARQR